MSYLVLARKWRPKKFEEVVGQEHVVRTLQHALDNNRLHHAYLFTGTRGVGKTTLARIVAKSLNCENGVSSRPCNECKACTEIDEGRFIDLIEVDAASRTKVEDTRSLLENVPYKATIGRYKVYLIDEIHMLTGHSFNALLKTLEEPPSHVKFLMATTDPQKLPVTVLSRCIQFNLRAMDEPEISEQLRYILTQENIRFEIEALNGIARQSKGSMRDGLSLLDQAISYTKGNVRADLVRDMLGMVSDEYIFDLLKAIAAENALEALQTVEKMCERSIDFEAALDDILLKLHDLSLMKIEPTVLKVRSKNLEELKRIDELMSPEDIQLFYQIGLIGKRDLPLAPRPQLGFEMVLMRMLAFHPNSARISQAIETPAEGNKSPLSKSTKPYQSDRENVLPPAAAAQKTPASEQGRPYSHGGAATAAAAAQKKPASERPAPSVQHPRRPTQHQQVRTIDNAEDWIQFVNNSKQLTGWTKIFASKVAFQGRSGNKLYLQPPAEQYTSITREQNRTNLLKDLRKVLGDDLEIIYSPGAKNATTPERRMARERREKLAAVRRQIERESIPKSLRKEFGAKIDRDSIRYPALSKTMKQSEEH